jgi:xanthine/CO dehydrogenase XdhC/CoxF family maturation factor
VQIVSGVLKYLADSARTVNLGVIATRAMRELIDILAAFDALCEAGKPSALATVIGTEGSAYRRPGARMLVAENGRTWGGVSGGCLERDVARRARAVIETGRPVLTCYDTRDDDELAQGAATGCGGVVNVFIQPLFLGLPGPIPFLRRVIQAREKVILATAIRGPAEMIGHTFELPDEIGASDDLFVEKLVPSQAVVLFGAGSDALPLVAIAKTLGWHVTVVGMRPATGLAERFAAADVRCITDADEPTRNVPLPPDAAVVVMSHNIANDRRILAALPHPLRYLGLLGPRHRTRRILADLADGGITFPRSDLFYPVGLDLGARTPEEIALAIVAEIQAAIRGTTAIPLRDRPGPIHARPDGATDDAGGDGGPEPARWACPV